MRTSESSTFDTLTRLRPDPVADSDQTRIGLARLQREITEETTVSPPRRRRRSSRTRRLVLAGASCAVVALPIVVFRGSPTAYADLTPLAERAERQQSLQPGPGEYYYRRTQPGPDDVSHRYAGGAVDREEWIGPPGALATTLTRQYGNETVSIWRGHLAGYTVWADLPTNPILLEARLRARASGSLNQDEAVWKAVGYALVENPDPEHRAAMIKVLPRLTHVTVRDGVDALGRSATIITRTEPMRGPEYSATLLLDPASGRILEQRSGGRGMDDTAYAYSRVTVAERLVDGPPPWVPLPGMTCKKVESDPQSEVHDCR